MPSRHDTAGGNFEGFGISYLEANACGLPVVGADTGGVADAIVDGVTGFLVPTEDVPALTDRLQRLLEEPAAARRMGEAGRRRVLAEFTWERIAAQFLAALEEKTGPLVLPSPFEWPAAAMSDTLRRDVPPAATSR